MGYANLQNNLAAQIKHLRSMEGITQVALAQRSGLSKTQIASIESGAANPTLASIQALATALDVPPGVLFGASDET